MCVCEVLKHFCLLYYRCENSLAKYACPKCNIQYCSVDCYRSEAHGQCSEDFYRDCVLSELGSQDADPQARTRMLEMLSRLHNSEFEGDGNELGKYSS